MYEHQPPFRLIYNKFCCINIYSTSPFPPFVIIVEFIVYSLIILCKVNSNKNKRIRICALYFYSVMPKLIFISCIAMVNYFKCSFIYIA